MSSSDDEEQLRGRVERSIAGMPGPDPARLAMARPRNRRSSSKLRRGLFLLAVGVATLGGAAATVWVYRDDAADSKTTTEQSQEASATAPADERIEPGDAGDATDTAHGFEERDEAPVIYRD